MSKDPKILLRHILESIEDLESYLAGVNEEQYLTNKEKQDAAERRLQIIGEAIIQLPDEFKDSHPEIEWGKVAGLRNRLVHQYFDVDHGLIWNILTQSLPNFKAAIKESLQDL
jgi:uncharacterized protein with HEPN domain